MRNVIVKGHSVHNLISVYSNAKKAYANYEKECKRTGEKMLSYSSFARVLAKGDTVFCATSHFEAYNTKWTYKRYEVL